MMDTAFAPRYYEENRHRILEDYFNLLKIPTVGAEERHLGDCARAAAW